MHIGISITLGKLDYHILNCLWLKQVYYLVSCQSTLVFLCPKSLNILNPYPIFLSSLALLNSFHVLTCPSVCAF